MVFVNSANVISTFLPLTLSYCSHGQKEEAKGSQQYSGADDIGKSTLFIFTFLLQPVLELLSSPNQSQQIIELSSEVNEYRCLLPV